MTTLTAMETNTKKGPLDVEARLETVDAVLAELEELEGQLAAELGMQRRMVRSRLVPMLRAGEINETELVERWLAAYDAAMEYIAERVADPPRDLHHAEDQGPQDAALAVFGGIQSDRCLGPRPAISSRPCTPGC